MIHVPCRYYKNIKFDKMTFLRKTENVKKISSSHTIRFPLLTHAIYTFELLIFAVSYQAMQMIRKVDINSTFSSLSCSNAVEKRQ